MKKLFIVIVLLAFSILTIPQHVFATSSPSTNPNTSSNAEGKCPHNGFLGFRPWYAGLDCPNGSVTLGTGDEIPGNVWAIVLNILSSLLVAVGYLSVGFIIYGGYLYVLSQGSSDTMTKAKKTLTNAVIGLVIAILANAIVVTILNVLTGQWGGNG